MVTRIFQYLFMHDFNPSCPPISQAKHNLYTVVVAIPFNYFIEQCEKF